MHNIVTPHPGCDVFVLNEERKLLLIQRADNGLWALPGGYQNRGETPMQCAIRECIEETGLETEITDLLGVFSSLNYELKNYPVKDIEICHLLFLGKVTGGKLSTSEESKNTGWFSEIEMPQLSDGHEIRIKFGWKFVNGNGKTYLE